MAGLGELPRGHRLRYQEHMAEAERRYSDVLEALLSVGVYARMTQTGGMCLGIEIPFRDGYLLLTDEEDSLSFDRRLEQGWGVGLYDADGEPIDLDCETTVGVKTASTAVMLMMKAIRYAKDVRWPGD